MDGSKLELGAGHEGALGYLHNDVADFDGIDMVGPAWEVSLPDNSLDEVLALGVIEHLTYAQVEITLANVHRMLKPGCSFYFDVPDIPVWCGYLVDSMNGKPTPFTREHIYATLYGWQRWSPGDEHKSGWDKESLAQAINDAGFTDVRYGVKYFTDKGFCRRRMTRPLDAHIYAVVTK